MKLADNWKICVEVALSHERCHTAVQQVICPSILSTQDVNEGILLQLAAVPEELVLPHTLHHSPPSPWHTAAVFEEGQNWATMITLQPGDY